MGMPSPMAYEDMRMSKTEPNMEQKRTTPEFITELQPNEIFVFGSNLKGMHGGVETNKPYIREDAGESLRRAAGAGETSELHHRR